MNAKYARVVAASTFAVLALSIFAASGFKPQDRSTFFLSGMDTVFLVPAPELLTVEFSGEADTSWLAAESARLTSRRPAVERPGNRRIVLATFERSIAPALLEAVRETVRRSQGITNVLEGFRVDHGGDPLFLTGELVIRFRQGVSESTIDSVILANSLEVLESVSRPGYRCVLVRYQGSGPSLIAASNAIHRSGLVRYAHPNFVARNWLSSPPSDSFFVDQYYLNSSEVAFGVPVDLRILAAWDYGLGTDIKIAILDVGVECGHQEFSGRVLTGRDAYAGQSQECAPPTGSFAFAHGTAVAAIALANRNGGGVAGVAPGALLIPVRITGTTSPGCVEQGNALRWAWDSADADVIVNSWYTHDHANCEHLNQAIADGFAEGRNGKGTVIVWAAGNESGGVEYPATVAGAYSVSGVTRSGGSSGFARGADVVAPTDSSNHGLPCNQLAPGAFDVTTADRAGAEGYNSSWPCNVQRGDYANLTYTRTFGGTSAAAPQVGGVAALVLAVRPQLGASDVVNTISAMADDWFTVGWDSLSGNGKVNAYRAVRKAGPTLDVAMWASGYYVTQKQLVARL